MLVASAFLKVRMCLVSSNPRGAVPPIRIALALSELAKVLALGDFSLLAVVFVGVLSRAEVR